MNKINCFLEALHSERDVYGNRYWALRFTDCVTGKRVEATVSGDESNIYGLLHCRDGNAWNRRDFTFRVTPVKKREFQRLVKAWPHAGCAPEELWTHIQKELARP